MYVLLSEMCLSCTRTSADLFSTNISFLVVCSTTCMWGKLTVVRIEIMYCCNGVLMGNLGGTVYHEYKSQHPHTVTHTHTTNQLLESSSSLFAACRDSTVILCFEPHVSGAFPQFLFVWHYAKVLVYYWQNIQTSNANHRLLQLPLCFVDRGQCLLFFMIRLA